MPKWALVCKYLSESESRSVVSDCLRPHRLYSPWNSPGQNTKCIVKMSIGVQVSEYLFSVQLELHSGVELLGHILLPAYSTTSIYYYQHILLPAYTTTAFNILPYTTTSIFYYQHILLLYSGVELLGHILLLPTSHYLHYLYQLFEKWGYF